MRPRVITYQESIEKLKWHIPKNKYDSLKYALEESEWDAKWFGRKFVPYRNIELADELFDREMTLGLVPSHPTLTWIIGEDLGEKYTQWLNYLNQLDEMDPMWFSE